LGYSFTRLLGPIWTYGLYVSRRGAKTMINLTFRLPIYCDIGYQGGLLPPP